MLTNNVYAFNNLNICPVLQLKATLAALEADLEDLEESVKCAPP